MINTAKNILTKESATDALKTQKEQFKKQQKQILIWLLAKIPQLNNSETVTNEHDKEIAKETYIFPEERQKIFDDLRLT